MTGDGAETIADPPVRGVSDRLLAGVATALRGLVNLFVCRHPAPGPVRRTLTLIGFVPAFGLWMLLRWTLMLRRRRVHVEAVTDDGLRLACPLPDMIPMYLHLFGVWEPDVTEYIRRSLRAGDTMIDVGANHGAFALLAAQRVGADGAVIAVEAMPTIAEALRHNIARNRSGSPGGGAVEALAPIEVVVAAASDGTGELTIHEGPFENLGRTTTVGGRGERPVGTVPCAPLPELVGAEALRRARVVKIDVEGAEAAVLAGLAPAIGELPDDVEIMVELSPHWWPAGSPDAAAVLAPFLDAGFRVYELPNDYWPWRYAFPRRVTPPTPLREPLGSLRRRVDLVLSRREVPAL